MEAALTDCSAALIFVYGVDYWSSYSKQVDEENNFSFVKVARCRLYFPSKASRSMEM